MRPLKLEVEGFTAFKDRVCLDFTDLDLFAITGPTGAGKSSLIDAICYALYGKVPRVATEVGACISLHRDRMQVTLEFRAGGRDYRVLRETRRKGAGSARLEVMGSSDWQPLADRAREVTQKVEEIVGLDFEAFIRSVILPQGQFQEFIAGSPERRRDVLDRLLRMDVYKRMQVRAGQEAQILRQRLAEGERRLREDLADATPETLKARKQELAETEAEEARLAALEVSLREAVEKARALSEAQAVLSAARARQEAAERKLEAATAEIEGGDARLEALRKRLEEAEARLAANGFDAMLFASLAAAANLALNIERMRKAMSEAEAKTAALEARAKAAAKALTAATACHAESQRELECARDALREAERHNLAATLKAGLAPGDVCPVCGGAIGELTDEQPSDLAVAEAAFVRAEHSVKASQASLNKASTDAAAADAALSNQRDQAVGQGEALRDAVTALAEALPQQKDRSFAAVQASLQKQKAAREEREELQAQQTKLSRALADAEAGLRQKKELVAVLAAEARSAGDAAAAAEQKLDAAREALARLLGERGLTEAARDLEAGLDPAPGLDSASTEAAAARGRALTLKGRLEQQVIALEQDIETAKALRKELAKAREELDITDDLSKMLQANRFQAYVQAQALRQLAEDGSRKLLELSTGRYEVEVAPGGQDFLVRDRWNDGESRSVRTLSGGETFLASLALALALAETLPGLAPGRRLALESIFLDEGFGSLDAEALDRAADALDALRGENRMVCVVTHLQELAQRLPARVVVNKTESGSSVSIA